MHMSALVHMSAFMHTHRQVCAYKTTPLHVLPPPFPPSHNTHTCRGVGQKHTQACCIHIILIVPTQQGQHIGTLVRVEGAHRAKQQLQHCVGGEKLLGAHQEEQLWVRGCGYVWGGAWFCVDEFVGGRWYMVVRGHAGCNASVVVMYVP